MRPPVAPPAGLPAVPTVVEPFGAPPVVEVDPDELAVPAATFQRIKDLYAVHNNTWPRGVVPYPPEYFRFTLAGLTSRLKIAIESCAKSDDFENVVERLHMFHTQEPPAIVMRKQLATFVEELRQMPLPQAKTEVSA